MGFGEVRWFVLVVRLEEEWDTVDVEFDCAVVVALDGSDGIVEVVFANEAIGSHRV